ncbi:coiled-coil domain-containing protein [Cricetulus griseus]|uniref:Coiled-coil domain-containing protein n=1 Tax=Cricetulus griseus TaxID=10029 RepID=A0A061INF8_CRIGR|nr:coiled-coil domain-containing protein [Cricetulus griseus]
MPKKFQGENSKSAAARARRAEAKAAADAKKQKELEDAYWKDEDKHVMRKEQRKEEKEKRRLEQLERKKETQRLLEEEDSRLKGGKAPRVAPAKVTRAQIEDSLRREQRVESVEKAKSHLELPLEENLNRRLQEEGSLEARTVEDAIAVLRPHSVAEDADRHPERRMRAAFTAFEEVQLPRLKQENPNMRLSQLKQLLKKEWLRSPDNPMNQRVLPFNTPNAVSPALKTCQFPRALVKGVGLMSLGRVASCGSPQASLPVTLPCPRLCPRVCRRPRLLAEERSPGGGDGCGAWRS